MVKVLPVPAEASINRSPNSGKLKGSRGCAVTSVIISRLLVVTSAADCVPPPRFSTEELRGRIRANIHELRIACIRNRTKNPLLQSLLAQIADKQLAARTLLLAEQQMDEAAIFTIHGFCQRMLSLNAFESPGAVSTGAVRPEASY